MFCFNDVLAFGAIRAATDHGVKIPDEVGGGRLGRHRGGRLLHTRRSAASGRTRRPSRTRPSTRLMSQIAGEPVGALEVRCDHRLMLRESSTGRTSTAGSDDPGARSRGRH
jgi:hypothetical protein